MQCAIAMQDATVAPKSVRLRQGGIVLALQE